MRTIQGEEDEWEPRSAWSKLATAARTALTDLEELSPGPARTTAEAKTVAIFDFCTLGLAALANAQEKTPVEEPIPGPTIALGGGDEGDGKKWPRWSLPASPFPLFFQKDVVITRAINAHLGTMGLRSLRGVSQGCLAYVDDSQDLLRFASAKYGLGLKEIRPQKLEVAGSVAFGTDVRDKSFIDTSSGYLQLLGPQLQHSDLKELSVEVSGLEGNVKGGPNFITLTISTGVPLYHLFERIPGAPSQAVMKWTTLAKGAKGVVEEINTREISTSSRVNGRSVAAVFSPHQDDNTSHVAALFSNDSIHLFRNTLHEAIALPAGKRPSVLRLYSYDLEGTSLALVAVHSEYLSIWRIQIADLSSVPLYTKEAESFPWYNGYFTTPKEHDPQARHAHPHQQQNSDPISTLSQSIGIWTMKKGGGLEFRWPVNSKSDMHYSRVVGSTAQAINGILHLRLDPSQGVVKEETEKWPTFGGGRKRRQNGDLMSRFVTMSLVGVGKRLIAFRGRSIAGSELVFAARDDSAGGDWRFCAYFSLPSDAGCYVNPRLLNQGLKVAMDSGDYLVYHMTDNNIRFLKIPTRVKAAANGNAKVDTV